MTIAEQARTGAGGLFEQCRPLYDGCSGVIDDGPLVCHAEPCAHAVSGPSQDELGVVAGPSVHRVTARRRAVETANASSSPAWSDRQLDSWRFRTLNRLLARSERVRRQQTLSSLRQPAADHRQRPRRPQQHRASPIFSAPWPPPAAATTAGWLRELPARIRHADVQKFQTDRQRLR